MPANRKIAGIAATVSMTRHTCAPWMVWSMIVLTTNASS